MLANVNFHDDYIALVKGPPAKKKRIDELICFESSKIKDFAFSIMLFLPLSCSLPRFNWTFLLFRPFCCWNIFTSPKLDSRSKVMNFKLFDYYARMPAIKFSSFLLSSAARCYQKASNSISSCTAGIFRAEFCFCSEISLSFAINKILFISFVIPLNKEQNIQKVSTF